MDNNVLHLDSITILVRNRQGIVFEEEVQSITSINEKGPFDVLPQHENFISIIKERLIVHRKNGETKEIEIGQGVLKVISNKAQVYIVAKAEDVLPHG